MKDFTKEEIEELNVIIKNQKDFILINKFISLFKDYDRLKDDELANYVDTNRDMWDKEKEENYKELLNDIEIANRKLITLIKMTLDKVDNRKEDDIKCRLINNDFIIGAIPKKGIAYKFDLENSSKIFDKITSLEDNKKIKNRMYYKNGILTFIINKDRFYLDNNLILINKSDPVNINNDTTIDISVQSYGLNDNLSGIYYIIIGDDSNIAIISKEFFKMGFQK